MERNYSIVMVSAIHQHESLTGMEFIVKILPFMKSMVNFIRASQVVLVVKNLPANVGDLRDAGSLPGLGRSPEGGHSNPLQCSCLVNPMDRGAWWATVHGVAKSRTRLKQLSMHACTHTLSSIFLLSSGQTSVAVRGKQTSNAYPNHLFLVLPNIWLPPLLIFY